MGACMADTSQPVPVKLDWSRLLGFDQAAQGAQDAAGAASEAVRFSRLGAKVGNKPAGVGRGPLAKLGAKVGTKTAGAGRGGSPKPEAKSGI
jgi:hypothetical protein